MKKVKVLIIDDSALTRSILKEIIGSDSRIEIVGTAFDPIMALEKIPEMNPDVLTLDLMMPKMDGITFLKKLSGENPIPTIVISGKSPKDSTNALQALENGAFEIIEKPDISSDEKYNEVKLNICNAIIAARHSREITKSIISFKPLVKKHWPTNTTSPASTQFYVIGASTGGPRLLKEIFAAINPAVKKGFVVVQHMPASFTYSFANRMNDESGLHVVEAKDNEPIRNGKVIIIPGDYHGTIQKGEKGYSVKLTRGEKVNRHRPSVDVMFESAAKEAAGSAIGIILTGMGEDGAKGMKKLRAAGSITMAQDKESSVVYSMPHAAIKLGAVQEKVNPQKLVQIINTYGE